ncbi:unnamed protein product [Paramecium sonneborni]|uniref:Uncharacterized protein n=1 Tax=Paramecium sonneborni TaxID=65129 RepID=A0A8S1RCG3_9CILI|nr:unnamed protein product [Paramecium sonneborni]
MNFLSENSSKKIFQQPYFQQKGTLEYKVFDKCLKIKIQITFSKDQKIIYSRDGVILRVQYIFIECKREEIANLSKNPEILKNMEQIKNLAWQGEKAQNNKKHGKWKASWNGEGLMNVGGYYKDGLKQGLWKEIIENYSTQAQVYLFGEYYKDLRRGKWSYIYKNNKIYGGLYNEEGQKKGKWIELSDGFMDYSQVIYIGQYNTNGIKVGVWQIFWFEGLQIGGGFYSEQLGAQEKKIGRWIELSKGFKQESQITYIGEYNIYGIKAGRWDTYFNWRENKKIGGGFYNEQEGSLIKIGRWMELSKNFRLDSQIIYNGGYNMKGQKIGKWDIFRLGGEQIGGGLYDEQEGGSRKIGRWIELSQNFYDYSQVTYNGEYNQNGQKVGRWNIMYNEGLGYKQIGGGLYDEFEGYSRKIGRWIELSDDFWMDSQVTYDGIYNKDGRKIDRWDIYLNYGGNNKIGGGSYNEFEGSSRKNGKWIELWEKFEADCQITYCGQYNKEGKKVGIWIEMKREYNEKRFKKIKKLRYDN